LGEFERRYPGVPLLLTHMTPTGRSAAGDAVGAATLRCYLPYDYPFAMRRFLAHFQPRFGVLLETELWPNLIATGAERGIPLMLANARLSERSARGYRRIAALAGESLCRLRGIAAQTEADAARLRALGAPSVKVLGNLKFDVAPAPELLLMGEAWREGFGTRVVILVASSRDGEERLLLDAWQADSHRGEALLVLVPRHPQRFDAVFDLARAAGFRTERRSTTTRPAPNCEVFIGDSMGEMPAYYRASDVAVIGGSLLPFGGQNLIEACAAGVPVLIGPHSYNFAAASDAAIAAGAALRVNDAVHALRLALALAADPAQRRAMSAQAERFAVAHRGAARALADWIAAQVR
jgi:3-deoxy-D-manno-octulosonic-acid transferase